MGRKSALIYGDVMEGNPVEILQWLAEMGDDVALSETPVDRFAESAAQRQESARDARSTGSR